MLPGGPDWSRLPSLRLGRVARGAERSATPDPYFAESGSDLVSLFFFLSF